MKPPVARSTFRSAALYGALCGSLLWACAPMSTPAARANRVQEAQDGAASELPSSTQEAVRVPAGWATMSAPGFERLALELLPGDLPRSFTPAGHATLAAALSVQDQGSVRAAVLLSRSQSLEAKETLMQRLEDRDMGPRRDSDAGDCTAAAGLSTFALSTADLDRLTAVVLGGEGADAPPHPDVDVRVEVARTLLERGRTGVVPFLLRVLREGTRSGIEQEVDWERKETMAWPKSRAAEVLCAHLQTEVLYDPDGAYTEMEAEIERLEALFAKQRAEESK